MRPHFRIVIVLGPRGGAGRAVSAPRRSVARRGGHRQARPAWLLLSVVADVRQSRDPFVSLAISARAARQRELRQRLPRDRRRVRGKQRAAGAGRRGHSPVFSGAPRADERDRRLRDDRPRAPARHGDRARAAGLVRLRLRARHDRGEPDGVPCRSSGPASWRLSASLGALVVLFVLAGDPARLGRAMARLERVAPSALAALIASVVREIRRRVSGRSGGRRGCWSRWRWSFPLWLSIALGHLGGGGGVQHRRAVHGHVPADGAPGGRRRGADARARLAASTRRSGSARRCSTARRTTRRWARRSCCMSFPSGRRSCSGCSSRRRTG